MPAAESPLQREQRELDNLCLWIRNELYAGPGGVYRAMATTAIAASAAQEAHRLSDDLPDWRNAVSDEWRAHLDRLWAYLAGDPTQHYPLSAAIAAFLTSPLNHNEGDAGPDDFDRPQTVASYYAVVSALMWGVDFAVMAVSQVFDLLDIRHEQEFTPMRVREVDAQVDRMRGIVERVIAVQRDMRTQLSGDIINAIR